MVVTLGQEYSGGAYIVRGCAKPTDPHYTFWGVNSAGSRTIQGFESLNSAGPALLASVAKFNVGYLWLHPPTAG